MFRRDAMRTDKSWNGQQTEYEPPGCGRQPQLGIQGPGKRRALADNRFHSSNFSIKQVYTVAASKAR